jgi:hypothetical protein
VLAVVDCKTLVVEFYDSLATITLSRYFDFWREAHQFWLAKFAPTEFLTRVREYGGLRFLFATVTSQHQAHGNACGAYVCYYMLRRIFFGDSPQRIRFDTTCTPQYMESTLRPYLKQQLKPFVE